MALPAMVCKLHACFVPVILIIINVSSTFFHADINECTEQSDRCAQTCINSVGSYTCTCTSGYRLSSNGYTCNGMDIECNSPLKVLVSKLVSNLPDVDECTEDIDGCAHTCTNVEGSFTCGCNVGYQLNRDGRTCQGTVNGL